MSRKGVPRPGTGRMPITCTAGASIAGAGLTAFCACASTPAKRPRAARAVLHARLCSAQRAGRGRRPLAARPPGVARPHALEDAIALKEMLERRRDVQHNEGGDETG